MNAPPPDAARADTWQALNDAHLAAVIACWRLRLAQRVRPDAEIKEDLAPHLARQMEAEAELERGGHLPALTALAQRCGLDGFAAEVIALCLACEADGDCAAMQARAGGVAGRPTPGLALALLGAEAPSRLLAFAPNGELVALRLIEIEPGAPLVAAPMRLAPRVRDFLLGLDRLDEAANFLKPLAALDLPRGLAGIAARAAAELRGGAGVVGLVGGGTLGAAVAAMAARGVGLLPMRLDASALPADPAPALMLGAREAALSRLALVVEMPAPDPLLARPPAPLLLLTRDAAALPAAAPRFALPEDGIAARAALWRAAAPGLSAGAARRLARQFDPKADAIARIAGEGGEAAIWQRARAAAAPALAELGERITPRASWDDLVLPAETLAALREVAAAAATREVVETRWRMASPGARGQGLAVLLAGPSGTGKTLAAEVLAGALGLDLFRIDLAGVVSKWIGETEKNLARVFDAAAAGGAVLFFDEADALFGKRSEVNDSHDRYANVEVAYLLQRMEAHRGVSILATNLRANLDPAFLRRLRFAIDLPFPDEAARRAIWARHLPKRAPLAEDVDLDALARLDLPGGAIRNVALNGASLAAAAGGRIAMAHLLAAARREFAKLGRLARAGGR